MSEGFFEDPYSHYATVREHNPVQVDDRGTVLCFAYDDVRRILLNAAATSMDRQRSAPPSMASTRLAPPTFPLGLINRDPPDHTRLRRLLSRAFSPRSIAALVAALECEVDRLLDDLEVTARETAEPVDLVSGLVFPVPFRVISDMLGMPSADDTQVRAWAHDISRASDPMVTRDEVLTAIAAYRAIGEHVTSEVLPWKANNPADDLLTHLLAAEADGELSRAELVDNVALLYVAGHETTTGLMGNCIVNLLRHRDQLELLLAEPALMPNAVAELNRYDSSVQFCWRYIVETFHARDVELYPGAMAFLCTGSANRDPAHFGDTADRLDITRPSAKESLSFGAGLHVCLGAHLARQETAVVLERLFRRFPRLELAGDPAWGRRLTFRAVEHLAVTAQ